MKGLNWWLAAALVPAVVASLFWDPALLREVAARDEGLARTILLELRLPRTGLALLIGGSLGLGGAAMQALLRNPLASPDVLGPSTGAALGAVLAGYFLGFGVLGVAAGGMMGALAALILLLALAGTRCGRRRHWCWPASPSARWAGPW